jgi:thiamine pyrophosphokinase
MIKNGRKDNMAPRLKNRRTVILADGSFPVHQVPLKALREAEFIVCCDGAAGSLVAFGMEPDIIIGDLDSLKKDLASRFADRLIKDTDQETNDLTKAVRWCSANGATEVVIIGATGKGEDHTLGNISLLSEYGKLLSVKMLTDTATIFPEYGSCTIKTFLGQRVSIFSLDSSVELSAEGLKYPLKRTILSSWWTATLNIATGNTVTLIFQPARLLIYLGYRE